MQSRRGDAPSAWRSAQRSSDGVADRITARAVGFGDGRRSPDPTEPASSCAATPLGAAAAARAAAESRESTPRLVARRRRATVLDGLVR